MYLLHTSNSIVSSLLSQYEEGSGSERGGLRLPKSRYKGDTHLNSRQCLDMLALNEFVIEVWS